jgi:chemotaxis protein MotB
MMPERPVARAAEINPEPVPLRKSAGRPSAGLRRKSVPDSGNDIWFLTLSDLLLLLVIFFVLLFGLSWQQLKQPSSAPASAGPALAKVPAEAPAAPPDALTPPPLSSLEKDLSEFLGTAAASGITLERRGPALVLTFPERIVFDTAEARLKPGADPILTEVGNLLQLRPELLVEVQGHTDDRPIRNTRYPSNWELSTDRATQVARTLITRGAAPQQISVKGFGEYRALAPNDTEANRLKNRRVEILFSFPGGLS